MNEYQDLTTVEIESGQVWCNDGENFYILIQNLETQLWNAIWLSRSDTPGSLQMYSTIDKWKSTAEMCDWIENDILIADTGNMWIKIDKWLAKEI